MSCMLLFHSRLHTEPQHSYVTAVRIYSSNVPQYAYILIRYSPYQDLPICYSFINRPKHWTQLVSYLHQLHRFIRSSLDISLWHALHTNTNLSRSSKVYSLGVIWWSWGVLVLHPQHAHFPSQSSSNCLRHCFHWAERLYSFLTSFPFIFFIIIVY